MSHHVFTYGSLMFPQVWSALVIGRYRAIPARLRGYKAFAVLNQEYPMLLEAEPDALVFGTLYLAVSEQDIACLDNFEGDEYCRVAVKVCDQQGSAYTAQTYLANELGRSRCDTEIWDREAFERDGLQRFCASYVGFQKN